MAMRFEVLGSHVAALGGGCSAYLVRGKHGTLMLDCGTGAFERLWRSGAMATLDAIVVSHMHHDHMIDVLPFTSGIAQSHIASVRDPDRGRLILYVPRGRGPAILESLSAVVAVTSHTGPTGSRSALAGSRLAEVFDIREYDETTTVSHSGLTVSFAETVHSELCYAARVTDGDTTCVYTGDAAFTEDLVQHCADADLLVADATFFLEDDNDAISRGHMNVAQAARLAQLANARHLLLGHFIPSERENKARLEVAASVFDGRVDLALEGLEIATGDSVRAAREGHA